MADLLDSIRRQLRERLDELRPLVGEYRRLEAAEEALGERSGDGAAPAGRAAGQRRPRRSAGRKAATRTPSRTANRTPASRTANREKVLALIGERPGITKAELKQATGFSSAIASQNLRRLMASGRIREEALPGDQTGYRLGDGNEPASRTSDAAV
jgi:hypothetical protein